MGKAATLLRARTQEARQRHTQRLQRTQEARLKRRESAGAPGSSGSGSRNHIHTTTTAAPSARALRPMTATRPLPSSSDAQLLLRQFDQACRLPATVADLCAILEHNQHEQQHGHEEGQARGNETGVHAEDTTLSVTSIADAFVALAALSSAAAEDEDEDEHTASRRANADDKDDNSDTDDASSPSAHPLRTRLYDCLCDESGHRLAETLLRTLATRAPHTAAHEAVCAAVCETVCRHVALLRHPHAHRVVVALVRADPLRSAARIAAQLPPRSHVLAEADDDDDNDNTSEHDNNDEVLTEPHMAHIVEALLHAQPELTSRWMCDWLALDLSTEANSAAALRKRAREEVAKDDDEEEEERGEEENARRTSVGSSGKKKRKKDHAHAAHTENATEDSLAVRRSDDEQPARMSRVMGLIEDRVAGAVMCSFARVCPAAVLPLWQAVDAARLLTTKRGVSFLIHLLGGKADDADNNNAAASASGGVLARESHAAETDSTHTHNSSTHETRDTARVRVSSALCDIMADRLGTLACDGRANFVLQRVMDVCGAPRRRWLVQRLSQCTVSTATPSSYHHRQYGSTRQDSAHTHVFPSAASASGWAALVVHPVGVHVVVRLVTVLRLRAAHDPRAHSAGADATAQSDAEADNATATELATQLLTQHQVWDWLTHPQGSLVLRAYLSPAGVTPAVVRQRLHAAMEQHALTLAYDGWGNLVLQSYLTVAPTTVISALARRCIDGNEAAGTARASSESMLLAMSQHRFAAHVVGRLLDVADAATHTRLCGALRPHLLRLAAHVNGRFLVERLLVTHAESRAFLLRHVARLALEKGTQHLMVALLRHLDARHRAELVTGVLVPRLSEWAIHPCGSVTLQKLMQTDAGVCAAVRQAICRDAGLASTLAQSFHGRFVMQNANL